MKIGIVGSEAAKFTTETKGYVLSYLANLYRLSHSGDTVISGNCHLDGVDQRTLMR